MSPATGIGDAGAHDAACDSAARSRGRVTEDDTSDGKKSANDGAADNGELGGAALDSVAGGARIPRPLNPQPLPPMTL